MTTTRCKLFTDTVLNNLLDAQKNMASAEKVDARGLIRLSRFIYVFWSSWMMRS